MEGADAEEAVVRSGVDPDRAADVLAHLDDEASGEGYRANILRRDMTGRPGDPDADDEVWGSAYGVYRLSDDDPRGWTIFYPDRAADDDPDPDPVAIPLENLEDAGGVPEDTPPPPTPRPDRRRAGDGGAGGHGGGTPPPGGGHGGGGDHGGTGGGDHGDGHGEHGPKQRWWRSLKNRKPGLLGGIYSGLYALSVPGPWLNDQMVNRGWGTESNAGRRIRKTVAVAGGMAVRATAGMVMSGRIGQAYESAVEGLSDLDLSDVVDWVQDIPEATREKLGEIAEDWNNDHESGGSGGDRGNNTNPPSESVIPDSELPEDVPGDWDVPGGWTDKKVDDYHALHDAGMTPEDLQPIFENPDGPEATNLENFFDWVTDTKDELKQEADLRGESLTESDLQERLDQTIEQNFENLEEVNADQAPDIEAPEVSDAPEAPDTDAVEVPEGSGQGITDKIHDIEPGLDGGEYMDIYQDVVDRYGKDGIFEGIETYIDEPTGEVRLYPGEGRWAPGVQEFIHEQAEQARQSLEDSNSLEAPQ